MIASAEGDVRYVISKPFDRRPASEVAQRAQARYQRQLRLISSADAMNPQTPYMSAEAYGKRIAALASFSALHGG